MRIGKILISVISVLIASRVSGDSLYLIYPEPQNENVNIKIVYLDQIPYLSLLDFARAYNLNTYYKKETGKMVLYFPRNSVKVTINSTYIMVDSEVKHIPHPPILVDGDIFVPAFSFLTLLKQSILPTLEFSILQDKEGPLFIELISEDSYVTPMREQGDKIPISESAAKINLTGIQYEEKKNGLVIKIGTNQPFVDSDFSHFIRENWFYLTIYKGLCDSLALSGVNPVPGIAKAEAIVTGKSVQLSFKLTKKFTSPIVKYDSRTSQIIVSLYQPLNAEIKEKIKEAKSAWVIDTIVLDPGHGGKDSGTPGRWGNMHEKDIVLDIALRLGNLLEEKADLNVVYTRKTDVFVPLWQRTEIANKSGGKLFVSLHVDGVKSSKPDGVCFYFLSPAKSQDAIELAERENSVIGLEKEEDKLRYQGYDDISNILANMVYSANMKDSEKFAEILSKRFSEKVPQKVRGVKQANFYVLVGASMPNVLCELGFNSNHSEAEKLNKREHRQLIAEILYEGIIEFKELNDRAIAKESEL
jgi:N-acetylmuramoyl-L-alanine amidase